MSTNESIADKCSLSFSDGSVIVLQGSDPDDGQAFDGSVEHWSVSQRLLSLLLEYDKAVNGQVFNYADEISKMVEELSPKVTLPNGREPRPVQDLQVYPSSGAVSFTLGGA